MSALVGVLLALATLAMARATGLDRSRAFFPCVLIAIATYDVVFATVTGSAAAIARESALASVFVATAVIGFRYSAWLVALGLAAHGAADFLHDGFAPGAGIPDFWPAFCCAYDGVAAAGLALRLRMRPASTRHDCAVA